MEVHYIANARFPTEKAHGLQIAKTIDALQQNGVRVKLVLPWRDVPHEHRLPTAESYYSLKTRIRTLHLPCIDLLWLAQGKPRLGQLLYILQTLSFMISATVYGFFHRLKILYSRDPLLLWLISLLHRNFFVELHTFPTTALGRSALRWVLAGAKGVIVTNVNLIKKVQEAGVEPHRILVAPNGADLELISKLIPCQKAKQELEIPKNKKVILYLGNFYRSKGVFVLLEASQRLPQDTLVLFVGGSQVDQNIKSLTELKQRNALDQVRIEIHQPRVKVPIYLSAADVCVLPNIPLDEESEFFTTPLKMFDYMIAKRPIVASDLPAIRTTLREDSAWLVKPADPDGLAAAILEALNDKRSSIKKARNAFRLAQRLSWNQRAKHIKNFIEAKR